MYFSFNCCTWTSFLLGKSWNSFQLLYFGLNIASLTDFIKARTFKFNENCLVVTLRASTAKKKLFQRQCWFSGIKKIKTCLCVFHQQIAKTFAVVLGVKQATSWNGACWKSSVPRRLEMTESDGSSLVPVRIAWSTRSVVEWMAVSRISAGTLSPTVKKKMLLRLTCRPLDEDASVSLHFLALHSKFNLHLDQKLFWQSHNHNLVTQIKPSNFF